MYIYIYIEIEAVFHHRSKTLHVFDRLPLSRHVYLGTKKRKKYGVEFEGEEGVKRRVVAG